MSRLFLLLLLLPGLLNAQNPGPEVTSWIINVNNATGYGGIKTNVQLVRYSAANVYVTTASIPSYNIGPWPGNPNTPSDQNFCFKITRNPSKNNGTLTATPMGHIGVWSNGVSIFNAKDARSYNNAGIWNQNALFFEGSGFDDCLGHPAPGGEYHHHVNPTCLYNDKDSLVHSPIIGYAFDGFPIYGAYGYTNANGTGAIKRMVSGYRIRNISDRTSLPNGTVLQASQYGPALNNTVLGAYLEDFEYVQGLGDLDEHNGRTCVTPEYPGGTYAYFVSIDANLQPAYPYTLGSTYYGTVQAGNTGPTSGHNTPSEAVDTYNPTTAVEAGIGTGGLQLAPNPASGDIFFRTPVGQAQGMLHIWNAEGRLAGSFAIQDQLQLSVQDWPRGIYMVQYQDQSGQQLGSTRLQVR